MISSKTEKLKTLNTRSAATSTSSRSSSSSSCCCCCCCSTWWIQWNSSALHQLWLACYCVCNEVTWQFVHLETRSTHLTVKFIAFIPDLVGFKSSVITKKSPI